MAGGGQLVNAVVEIVGTEDVAAAADGQGRPVRGHIKLLRTPPPQHLPIGAVLDHEVEARAIFVTGRYSAGRHIDIPLSIDGSRNLADALGGWSLARCPDR